MPYMYPDLNMARDMADAGAACIMPLGAPIGSNKGLCTKEFIQILIDEIDLPIIVDAGIGRPSQACEAMEMGAAAVMANTAIASSGDVKAMAGAMGQAVQAGRTAYLAGLGQTRARGGSASSHRSRPPHCPALKKGTGKLSRTQLQPAARRHAALHAAASAPPGRNLRRPRYGSHDKRKYPRLSRHHRQ